MSKNIKKHVIINEKGSEANENKNTKGARVIK